MSTTFLGRLFRRVFRRGRVDEMVEEEEEEGIDPEMLMHWRPRSAGEAACGASLGPGALWTIEGPFATCSPCNARWKQVDMGRFLKLR